MTDVRSATTELLKAHPELEADLRTLLTIDQNGPWTFDDVPLDSGLFGEIVAAGIVDSTDDTYRLRDPDAVRAALEDDPPESSTTESESNHPSFDGRSLASLVNRPTLGRLRTPSNPSLFASIVVVLLLVVLTRTIFSFGAVFREEHVVFLANDPFYYAYWLEEILRTAPSLDSFPQAGSGDEVLMLVTLWAFTLVFGGTQQAATTVLAWYPVIAAVVVGGLLYLTASTAFSDRRVGLGAVAMYAVTPILAYRSALGFADHHAFDYFLLALTVFGVVLLADSEREWQIITIRRIVGVTAVAIGIAGQVHAWKAGALLVTPLAVYVPFRVFLDLRAQRSPAAANVWLLTGFGLASFSAALPYVFFGWSGSVRSITPLLLFIGSLLLVGVGVVAKRREIGATTVFVSEILSGIILGTLLWITSPTVRSAITGGVSQIVRLSDSNIVESTSLFSLESGFIITPIYYLGFSFLFALAGLFWVTYRQRYDQTPAILVLMIYGWVLFAYGIVQLRFAAQFGIVATVFASVAFVQVLSYVDLTTGVNEYTEPLLTTHTGSTETASISSFRLPDLQILVIIVALFALVSSFGMLQIAVDTNQLTVEQSTYEASITIEEHATLTETNWPDNYVFSAWDQNRAYNYIVSGQSESYGYAQEYYTEFLRSTDPNSSYEQLKGQSVGYVVVRPQGSAPVNSMQTRLWSNRGSATDTIGGLAHYQLIYSTDDIKVYNVVPGAELTWQDQSGASKKIQTSVTVGNQSFLYERYVTATTDGRSTVRVPYAGRYSINNKNVTITEEGVKKGKQFKL